MTDVRAFLVDAFTDDPCTGNPAGVAFDADELADDQMQAVANELGASETAFVTESADAERRLRYFTPTTEVDLCGHATIASHARLFESGRIDAGTHTVKTNVGVLDIEVEESGTVWMTQNDPEIRRVEFDAERVADALGVDADARLDDLPLAVASTGLPFLVVPMKYLADLKEASPDFDALAELCEDAGAQGVYAFSFETLGNATLHGRAFCPLLGVDEDPVTGTASGATGAYLDRYGAFSAANAAPGEVREAPGGSQVSIENGMPDEMVFEQGHFLGRDGEVRVRIGDDVRVGGTASTSLAGEFSVPASDEDEILEA